LSFNQLDAFAGSRCDGPLQKEFAQRLTEIRALEAAPVASRRPHELFQSILHRAL
jgi:hypothetical protein